MRRSFRVAALVALALTGRLVNTAQAESATQVAPAFTPQQLLAPPRDAWITDGGTLYNQRYSPLTLISRDNVKNLRALWRTGMGSGPSPGHAGQAQILEYAGVLYVINGANIDQHWVG